MLHIATIDIFSLYYAKQEASALSAFALLTPDCLVEETVLIHLHCSFRRLVQIILG